MGESFCDGPILNTTMSPPQFTGGESFGGQGGWWDVWTNQTLQDYRDFAASHGGSTGNILFADGRVKAYQDQNQDGFLNPGFDPVVAANNGVNNIGYLDAVVELPAEEIFSGWRLDEQFKQNLDTQ